MTKPVYVRCKDGKYYRSPIWYGCEGTDKTTWMVVMDSDDPPEIIFKPGTSLPRFENCMRPYPMSATKKECSFPPSGEIAEATSMRILIQRSPPPPQQYLSVSEEQPKSHGVLYMWQE